MNRTIPRGLAACLAVAATVTAAAQTPGVSPTGVRDRAKMFSSAATSEADAALKSIERATRWQVVIETRDSLNGVEPAVATAAEAKKTGVRGLYVLIAKSEHHVQVEPSQSARSVFPKAEEDRVVAAFRSGMQKGDADLGLRQAVDEVRRATQTVGVRDHAGMFSADAVAKADAALGKLQQAKGPQVVVETVETLGGKEAKDVAAANAKALQVRGLYVLIAKKEQTNWVQSSGSAASTFTPDRVKAINDALVKGFKAQAFDRGLGDAVDLAVRDAQLTPMPAASAPATKSAGTGTGAGLSAGLPPGPDERPQPQPPRPKADAPPSQTPPAAGPSSEATAPRSRPPETRPAPANANVPAPAQAQEGSVMNYVFLAGGVLLVLWIVSRVFRRSSGPPQQFGPGQGYAPGPNPNQAYGPGYGPPPQGGYRPQPQAGYAPPPPGYGGYAPPPPAGGGIMGSVLGGMGGAVLGNILYDKFGRAHEVPQGTTHLPADLAPPAGSQWHQANLDATGGAAAPAESFDPNAGAGGDWGDGAATDQAGAGAGGDWGDASAPAPDGGGGGDWGNAADPNAQGAGGDWGSPDPAPDAGGGDWGGGSEAPDDGGGGGGGGEDENQGGGW